MGKIASILLPGHGLVLKDFIDVKEFAFTHIRTEPPRTHNHTELPRNALPPWTALPPRTAVPSSAGSNVIHAKFASLTVLLLARDIDLLSLRLGLSPSMKSVSLTVLLLARNIDFLSLRVGLSPSMLQHFPAREKSLEHYGEDDEEDAKASVMARV